MSSDDIMLQGLDQSLAQCLRVQTQATLVFEPCHPLLLLGKYLANDNHKNENKTTENNNKKLFRSQLPNHFFHSSDNRLFF